MVCDNTFDGATAFSGSYDDDDAAPGKEFCLDEVDHVSQLAQGNEKFNQCYPMLAAVESQPVSSVIVMLLVGFSVGLRMRTTAAAAADYALQFPGTKSAVAASAEIRQVPIRYIKMWLFLSGAKDRTAAIARPKRTASEKGIKFDSSIFTFWHWFTTFDRLSSSRCFR
jgi:hypothetical protein